MKNALEQFRQKEKLSYAEVGRRVGLDRATVMRHCKTSVSESAAPRYAARLGIPLEELLPTLFKGTEKP